MNTGKKQYCSIPIPQALDQTLLDAMTRAERDLRAQKRRKWLVGAAAVFCAVFISANIHPIYAYTAQLPVIGTVIQVLHIGDGGTITDGAQISAAAESETVVFAFESNTQNLNAVPVYSASHLLAPNRLVLTLYGVRFIDDAAIEQSLLSTQAVKSVRRAVICDDSACGFVIVLHSGYRYEITEYADPASLSVRFFRDADYTPNKKIYYLRSESMPYSEQLGILCERYWQEGATQLQTQSGDYIITIGQYETQQQAAAALEILEQKHGEDTGLFIASGRSDEIPMQ